MPLDLAPRSRTFAGNLARAGRNGWIRLTRGARPYRYLRVDLRGALDEAAPAGGLARMSGLAAGEHTPLLALIELLTAARRDPRLEGVYLRVGPLATSLAAAESVAEAVLRLRRAGKRVVAFLESGGHVEYLLAATAERVHLHPTGTLHLVGLSAEVLLFGEALKRLGVRADLEQVGRYKSAAEAFTRADLTPPARAALDELVGDLDDQLRDQLSRLRGLERARLDALLDEGPFLGPAALANGLVDALSFEDEVVAELVGEDGDKKVVAPRAYARLRYEPWRPSDQPRPVRVAWVPLVGAIRSGDDGVAGAGGASSGDVVARLTRARDTPGVRAVVLRVDSPGGSGLASDVIWREVVRTRRSVPVFVSMGGSAASGGYYVAAPATAIVAASATLTGSIGVFGGKLTIGRLLERAGIGHEAVHRGRAARITSSLRPFKREERRRLRAELSAFYETFVGRVAEGRSLGRERVEEIAQGRVWTGRQAWEHGLVDALGGILATLDRVREELSLAEDHPLELVPVERDRRWARLARWLRAIGALEGGAVGLLPAPSELAGPGLRALVDQARGGPVPLALMGFELRLR